MTNSASISASAGYRVQNPVDNSVVETFDNVEPSGVQKIIENAAHAYTEWSALSLQERGDKVGKLADLLEENKDALAEDSSLDMGKPLPEMIEEIEFSAEILRYYVDNAATFTEDQEIETSGGKAVIRRLPIGPLLGIMPWNFPYYQVARFIGPNLMLGNTIILKHAEICPRPRWRSKSSLQTQASHRACTRTSSPRTTRSARSLLMTGSRVSR